jgi:hypothetical protein
VPKYEQNRKSAAIVPDQKLYWFVRSNVKSNVWRRPVAPAIAARRRRPRPGQAQHQRDDRRDEAADDEDHLLDVGPGDGLHAAEHRVDAVGSAMSRHGGRDAQPEHHRQHDGRRRDHDAERHAARQQEQQAVKRARLRRRSAAPGTRRPCRPGRWWKNGTSVTDRMIIAIGSA